MSDTAGGRASLRVIAGDLAESLAREAGAAAKIIRQRDWPAEEMTDGDRRARPTRVAVVGGGIAGLSAAWSIVHDRGGAVEVVVFEADDRTGGKLRAGELEGIPIDEGAESMLAVRPEAVVLARSVGLAPAVVHPVTTTASIFSRGRMRQLPPGLISGVPTDLRALAASGIISVPGLLRIPLDHWLPRTSIAHDISVGDLVATRVGTEVVRQLVDPLLGGVYAGRAEDLSLEMTLPALFRLLRRDRSLISAAQEARRTGAAPSGARRGPVFAGLVGGVGRLPQALTQRLTKRGVVIETAATVTSMRWSGGCWQLLVAGDDAESGPAGGRSRAVEADAVVLAVPAASAAMLLRNANPHAASVLDSVEYASVAVVTMIHRQDAIPAEPHISGFLVPESEGYRMKAATFSSRKWAWMGRPGGGGSSRGRRRRVEVVRASFGRHGDDDIVTRDDGDLVGLATEELHRMAGLPRRPVAARVTRWEHSLPQYAVGHRGRVARIRELLVDTPGIVVCGAAFDGIGVPACVGSAQFAGGQVMSYLREKEQWALG